MSLHSSRGFFST
nr:unnamed protein product [Callosobruchus chinensis]CAH7769365.1 unnamed protein product [Callosobruchus chinensis]